MPCRIVSIPLILLLCIATIAFTFMYGPSRRTFVEPAKSVTVHSAQELVSLWKSSGMHGRNVVIFARHLNPAFSVSLFPEVDYLESVMHSGIVRKAYFIVPDSTWNEAVSESLQRASIVLPKTTATGILLLQDGGRIQVIPLSKYIPEQTNEKSLVVIEEGAWTRQDRFRIDNYFRSGLLTSDLVVHIGDAPL